MTTSNNLYTKQVIHMVKPNLIQKSLNNMLSV